MKKKINLIVLLLLLVFSDLNAQSPYFYYYDGKKQHLELDTKRAFISVANKNMESNVLFFDNAKFNFLRVDIPEGSLSKTKQDKRYWTVLNFEEQLSDEAYLAKLAEIKNSKKDAIVAPFFKDKYHNSIGLSNAFYVKLKEISDTVLLKQKVKKEQAVIMWQNEFMPLWFTINVTEESKYNAMEMANVFHEFDLFQYAEPDFITNNDISCADDTFWQEQWALNNNTQHIDIKACDAWQITTGSNIVVAVLDQGINLLHPDLVDNIYPLSYDCENRTSPQQFRDFHGTPCAGIIGSIRNNDIGVAGVAPDCKLMSVSNSMSASMYSRESRAKDSRGLYLVQSGIYCITTAQQLLAAVVVDNTTKIDGKEIDAKKMILTGEIWLWKRCF